VRVRVRVRVHVRVRVRVRVHVFRNWAFQTERDDKNCGGGVATTSKLPKFLDNFRQKSPTKIGLFCGNETGILGAGQYSLPPCVN